MMPPDRRVEHDLAELGRIPVPPGLEAIIIKRVHAEPNRSIVRPLFRRAWWIAPVGVAAVLVGVAILRTSDLPRPAQSSNDPLASAPIAAASHIPPSVQPGTSDGPVTPSPTSTYSTGSPTASPTGGALTGTLAITSAPLTSPLRPRFNASAVWTGTEVIVWGGSEGNLSNSAPAFGDGAAYDPVTNTWRLITDGPLEPRRMQLAAWTGNEMLVWGGDHAGRALKDGAAYDPVRDEWRPISDSPLAWSFNAASTWTGSEFFVGLTRRVAGRELLEFMAYDPTNDQWRTLPSIESATESETSLAWTATEIIVSNLSSGIFRMEPSATAWSAISAPPGPLTSNIAWTGHQIVGVAIEYLGPQEPRYRGSVAAWDPVTDSWTDTQPPSGDLDDIRVIAMGDLLLFPRAKLALDTTSGAWLRADTPSIERLGSVWVWVGDRLVVWGGGRGDPPTLIDDGVVITPER